MNEQDKERIKLEAQEILQKFSKALSKVRLEKKDLKEKKGGYRQELHGNTCDLEFRKGVFDNAPKMEGDFIIAEKKIW